MDGFCMASCSSDFSVFVSFLVLIWDQHRAHVSNDVLYYKVILF